MSATCGSSLTEQILNMKPESFSAIVKERLQLGWDSNIANVGLAAVRQSVAFLSQGERQEALAFMMRTPPRMQ